MTQAQVAQTAIADAMDALAMVPPGRARSLAQTKLEEAMMWTERAGREGAPADNSARETVSTGPAGSIPVEDHR